MAQNKEKLDLIGKISVLEYKIEAVVRDLNDIKITDKMPIVNNLMSALKRINKIKEEELSLFNTNANFKCTVDTVDPHELEMRDGIPSEMISTIRKLCLKKTSLAQSEVSFLSKKTDEQLKYILRDPIYLKRLKTIV